MPQFTRHPDSRINLAVIVVLFLALVAVGWAMRAGRIRNAQAPTPAAPGAPGPPGAANAPGTAPALPTPP